jgi:hypothetical protein
VVRRVSTTLEGTVLSIYDCHKKNREQPDYSRENGKNYGEGDDADSDAADSIKIILKSSVLPLKPITFLHRRVVIS